MRRTVLHVIVLQNRTDGRPLQCPDHVIKDSSVFKVRMGLHVIDGRLTMETVEFKLLSRIDILPLFAP
jgi:hypothetical protein